MATTDRKKFRIAPFSIWEDYIKMEFAKIREFIEDSSHLAEKEKRRIEEFCKAEEEKCGGDEEAIAEMYDFYVEDFQRYDRTFKNILLNTTFVAACSLFESLLKRTCVLNFTYVGNSDEVERPRGSYLKTYRRFLTDKVGLELDDLQQEWTSIADHYQVRNVITHSLSRLTPGSAAHQFLSKSSQVRIEEDLRRFVITDKGFVLNFIHVAESYLISVVKRLRIKYSPTVPDQK